MNGKIVASAILLTGLLFGGVVYYTQVYAYYDKVPESEAAVALTPLDGETPQPLEIAEFEGIDGSSSPIRYRACFTTPVSLDTLKASFQLYENSEPRNAPGWFDCFDAAAIGTQIEAGTAQVFTGQRNIEFGIDRVVAITEDGRGFVWHEINECGDKAYDGTPLGDECPQRD